MKTLFYFLGCLPIFGFSQIPILDEAPKVGIYANFFEFRFNSPSIPFDYEIEESGLYDNSLAYHLEIDKKTAKEIGQIYGFYDGQSFYVCEDALCKAKSKLGFHLLEYIGRYCIFYEQTSSSSTEFFTGVQSIKRVQLTRILDINNGEVFLLSKENLKPILQKDEELFEEFQNTNKKDRDYEDFLIRYSEKHTEEIYK